MNFIDAVSGSPSVVVASVTVAVFSLVSIEYTFVVVSASTISTDLGLYLATFISSIRYFPGSTSIVKELLVPLLIISDFV